MVKKYNEIEAKNNMEVEVGADDIIETAGEQKEERKQLQKIVDVQPKKVKRSLIGRLVSGVMGPDGIPSIGAYVNDEIIKPAIKNIIVDAVTSGINMVMYGEKNPNRGRSPQYGRPAPHRPGVNYSNRYRNQDPPEERRVSVRSAARYGVEEYILDDRDSASHVLVTLCESADRYNVVSVADYYDLIGVPTQYTDNNHGWTIDSISRATILPVRGGYIIKFPPVEVI